MKISMLLEREPFGMIFEQTVQPFLRQLYGGGVTVEWREKSSKGPLLSGEQVWSCYPRLNSVFLPGPCQDVRRSIRVEYSGSPHRWRSVFHKFYISLATSEMFGRRLAGYEVVISPGHDHADRFLFLGGNRRIRLLDFTKACCHVLGKAGFDTTWVPREIELRRQYQYLPSPKILSDGDRESWFSETLIVGTPINRLNDQGKYVKAALETGSALERLREETKEESSFRDYADNLLEEIMVEIKTGQFPPDIDLKEVNRLAQKISSILLRVAEGSKRLILSLVHGDFQPGNILWGEDGVWLIDWEYAAKRQSLYDLLVFALHARDRNRFVSRFLAALDGDWGDSGWIIDRWGKDVSAKVDRERIFLLFLLEELLLHLQENQGPYLFRQTVGFDEFLANAGDLIDTMAART